MGLPRVETQTHTRCRLAAIDHGDETYGRWHPISEERWLRVVAAALMQDNPDVRAWVERRR